MRRLSCRGELKGKKSSFDVDVTVGGSPYESDDAGVVSLEWKGPMLIVSTVFNPGQENQSDQIETWSLSPEGRRLIDDLIVHLPRNRGAAHIVRVLDQQ